MDLETIRREVAAFATVVDVDQTLRPKTLACVGSAAQPRRTLPALSIAFPDAAPKRPPQGPPNDIEVRGALAEGGMGVLYLADQRSLGREVVLKTLRDPSDEVHVAALLSEAAITGFLEHPNIPPVHQLGVDPGQRPILVMKRIQGLSWEQLLGDPAHPAWDRISTGDRLLANLEVLMQVARAVAFAHARGVVHRDIKPANVMVDETGEVYLVDWGIAKRLSDGLDDALVGTPNSMAPEMVTREALGPETDVYLLGATLHQILTGRPRHEGGELFAVLEAAHASAPISYPADLPEELTALANYATARRMDERPRTAAEFRAAVAAYLAHRGSLALSAAAEERLLELEGIRTSAALDNPRLVRLGAEARFGFDAALTQWPSSPRALAGRVECVEALARIEIDRENLQAARALASELGPASTRLTAGLALLEQKLVAKERERERLVELEKDTDIGVGLRQRGYIAFVLLVTSVGVCFWLVDFDGTLAPIRQLVWGAAIPTIIVAAGAVIARKKLLVNAASRRLYGFMFGACAFVLAHRIACDITGSDSVSMARADLFIYAMGTFAGGLTASRWWLMSTVALVAGAFVSVFAPKATAFAFGISVALAIGVLAVEMLVRSRRGSG